MLLLIVVVVAVGTFAYYLNNLQNQTQNREQFQNNVANEKLQITQLEFTLDDPTIQYEIYNTANTMDSYYVQMVSSSTVNLIQVTTGSTNSFTLMSSTTNPPTPMPPGTVFPAFYNSINFSTTAVIQNTTSPLTIYFISQSAGTPGNFAFRTATWNFASISVRNLNTLSSELRAIQVDGNWLTNSWYVESITGTPQTSFGVGQYEYNATSPPMTLPARSTTSILLNLTYLSIPRTQSMQIVLLSIVGNYFTTFYSPPNSLIETSVNTESLVTLARDVPLFDGSTSSSTNSTISYYLWRIDIPNPSWDGDWGEVSHIVTVFSTGSSIQVQTRSNRPNSCPVRDA